MHFPQLAQATSKFPSDVYCRLMFCSVPFCGWNEREGRGEGKGREGRDWTSQGFIPARPIDTKFRLRPPTFPSPQPALFEFRPLTCPPLLLPPSHPLSFSDSNYGVFLRPTMILTNSYLARATFWPTTIIFIQSGNFYPEVRNCLKPPRRWEADSWSES